MQLQQLLADSTPAQAVQSVTGLAESDALYPLVLEVFERHQHP